MPTVTLERRGAVALLTLDNPPANALGSPVLGELARAADTLRSDDSRAVVVTGAGRFFSAGLDLFEVAAWSPRPTPRASRACSTTSSPRCSRSRSRWSRR